MESRTQWLLFDLVMFLIESKCSLLPQCAFGFKPVGSQVQYSSLSKSLTFWIHLANQASYSAVALAENSQVLFPLLNVTYTFVMGRFVKSQIGLVTIKLIVQA